MEQKDFLKIPELPVEILNECLKTYPNLIIFIGAGLSKLFGFPLWDDLANDLLDLCKNGKTKASNSEIEIVKKNFDPINKITFAATFLDDIDGIICSKLDKNKLKKRGIKNKEIILKCLNSFKSTIVTTNADTTIDEINNYSKIWNIYPELSKDAAKYVKRFPAVIHMHGSIDKPDSLVFTLNEYSSKYSFRSKNGFANELADLFSINENKTILFIGYSLREFEMLQYILGFDKDSKIKRNIFKLDGYLKCEETKIDVDRKYYKSLGITLIPYSREIKDFDKLIDVLVDWSNNIERQQNIFQHPDYLIKDAILSKPDNSSKILVLNAIESISDERYFSSNLIVSPYFKDWMKIISKTSLFDARKNFKPSYQTEEGLYSSSFWEGLNIIESYIRKYGNDDFIVKLVKKTQKDCASLLKEDEEIEDIYLRRNTSFSIMHYLLDIMLTSSKYLNVKSISKTIISSAFASPFFRTESFIYALYEARDVLIDSNPDIVFWLYTEMIKRMAESFDYNKYFIFKEMEKIIANNSENYFKYSKKRLLKDKTHYSMGSFYEYNSIEYLRCDKFVPSYYLKESSKFIDDKMLREEIVQFISSDNEYANRMGLCLININFPRCVGIFSENIRLFCSKDTFYSDLRKLIEINGSLIAGNQDLFSLVIENIKNINYGKNEKNNETLKNGLLIALKPFDYQQAIDNFEMTPSEQKQLRNFNKLVYSEPIDNSAYIKQFYESIKDVPVNQLQSIIETKFSDLSDFYRDDLFVAIDDYLSKITYCSYKPYLRNIYKDYFGYYLSEIAYGQKILLSKDEKIDLLKSIIEADYINYTDYILKIIEKLLVSEEVSLNEKIESLLLFKYKTIVIEEKPLSEEKIDPNLTHGNYFYRYLKLLIQWCKKDDCIKKQLMEVYAFFKQKYLNNSIFIFDICAEYDSLLEIDNKLFSADFDLYFKDDSTYQYNALAFVSHLRQIIERIKNKDSFFNYIRNDSEDNELKTNILYRILVLYIDKGKFSSLKNEIVKINSVRVFENLYESLWPYPKLIQNIEFQFRLKDVTKKVIKVVKDNSKTEKYDRLIYVLSQLIINTDGRYDFLWDLVIELSSFIHSHLFEETSEMIDNFKTTHIEQIIQIVDGYIKSIESNHVSYYAKSLIDILNKLNLIENYKTCCGDAKRRLTSIDIKLNRYFNY